MACPADRESRTVNFLNSPFAPIVLLVTSNVFMTTAWYWHLRFKSEALWLVILVSWLIALVEYCFAVPANRFGSNHYTPAQLKTMQEIITLIVFVIFAWLYLGEKPTVSQGIGFTLIGMGAFFIFRK